MKIVKKLFTFVLVIAVVVSFSFFSVTHKAHGQANWGGHDLFTFPCTCSGPITWNFFAPLFLNTSVPLAGPLVAMPVLAYMTYKIHAGAWGLGKYTPVGVCCVGACPYCYFLPNYGQINPQTGSSPTG